jgi:hypothetical protein
MPRPAASGKRAYTRQGCERGIVRLMGGVWAEQSGDVKTHHGVPVLERAEKQSAQAAGHDGRKGERGRGHGKQGLHPIALLRIAVYA